MPVKATGTCATVLVGSRGREQGEKGFEPSHFGKTSEAIGILRTTFRKGDRATQHKISAVFWMVTDKGRYSFRVTP